MSSCRVCHTPFSAFSLKHSFFWFACTVCVKKAQTKVKFHKRRKHSQGGYSTTDWLCKLLEYEFKCAECGLKKPHLTLDHITSLGIGGQHLSDNIQPLCHECHSLKAHEENLVLAKQKKEKRKYAPRDFDESFLGRRARTRNRQTKFPGLPVPEPNSPRFPSGREIFSNPVLSGVGSGLEREWFLSGQFLPTACLDSGSEGVVSGPTWTYPENVVLPGRNSK